MGVAAWRVYPGVVSMPRQEGLGNGPSPPKKKNLIVLQLPQGLSVMTEPGVARAWREEAVLYGSLAGLVSLLIILDRGLHLYGSEDGWTRPKSMAPVKQPDKQISPPVIRANHHKM